MAEGLKPQAQAFDTERLSVRHWQSVLSVPGTRAWLEGALAHILTPRVLDHLPPSLKLDPGHLGSWIDARANESDVLLVRLRDDGPLIGMVFLAVDPEGMDARNVHIGYLLAEDAWGKGYATELLVGLVGAMRRVAGITLLGGVGKGNPASARVLEKAGFTPDPERSDHETDYYIHQIA